MWFHQDDLWLQNLSVCCNVKDSQCDPGVTDWPCWQTKPRVCFLHNGFPNENLPWCSVVLQAAVLLQRSETSQQKADGSDPAPAAPQLPPVKYTGIHDGSADRNSCLDQTGGWSLVGSESLEPRQISKTLWIKENHCGSPLVRRFPALMSRV